MEKGEISKEFYDLYLEILGIDLKEIKTEYIEGEEKDVLKNRKKRVF